MFRAQSSDSSWRRECIEAFKNKDKHLAKNVLSRIRRDLVCSTKAKLDFRTWNGIQSVSLLHLAAHNGWKDMAVLLVKKFECPVHCQDDQGHIPLHYAANYGHFEVVEYLASLYDPTEKNKHGSTPLHFACSNGHLKTVRYMIKEVSCNPSCTDESGSTPLHYASSNGHLNIAQYLISEAHCDPSCTDKSDSTPLHYACSNGRFGIVKYLIVEEGCDPSLKNKYGSTPLHLASHLDITQYLVKEKHCDPSCTDNSGFTPLHHACSNGHLDIAQYLIREKHCDPLRTDNSGSTPLHHACSNGHLDIAKYLISEAQCDPSCRDNDGSTPLHRACFKTHHEIVRYLLSTGRIDPLAKNNIGRTPFTYATGKYDIVRLFMPLLECQNEYPVHTYGKMILVGDSGAGKTTVTEHIKLLVSKSTAESVGKVECLTAGIIPHQVKIEKGNFVIYDFAGQQEYYSSHAAILEQVMCKSAALFLCLIDLSKSNEGICQSLHYWITFIENACNTIESESHVVIIGSHADLITEPDEIEAKSSLLKKIAEKRMKNMKHQQYTGYLSMDCRCVNTDVSPQLISLVNESHKAITASQPSINVYCHVLYAFLHSKLELVGCTLDHLISLLSKENDSSLTTDRSLLTERLTILSDKGLIVFIQHHLSQSSWVIEKTEALLKEINGTLFAPDHFKEHRDLASNTGIVTISKLHEEFPKHSSEMLVGFLTSLKFCQPVDPSELENTNLATCIPEDQFLFFPGLVSSERPPNLAQSLEFGWCLGCRNPEYFFGSRFLHLLLLSAAYRYPLSNRRSHSPLQRRCIVWRNGISWTDSDNITTLVELISNNQWVVVAMSSSKDRPMEHAKRRSSLVSLVLNLHQKQSPNLEVCDYLISPGLVLKYPFNDLPNADLFDIQDVAKSILCRKPFISSQSERCIGRLPTQSLPLEPYHLLSPSSVCDLFNMADQPVPSTLQKMIKNQLKVKQVPQVYKEVRECLDKLSLFAGRNPLVSCVAVYCN